MERVEAIRWMQRNVAQYVDPQTGEVNCTGLAEGCADAFDVADGGGPLDDETHPIWRWAVDVAQWFERAQSASS